MGGLFSSFFALQERPLRSGVEAYHYAAEERKIGRYLESRGMYADGANGVARDEYAAFSLQRRRQESNRSRRKRRLRRVVCWGDI